MLSTSDVTRHVSISFSNAWRALRELKVQSESPIPTAQQHSKSQT